MEMEKKLVKIPANGGKCNRRSCEVVSFTDRRMLSWCKLLGAIIILLRGVDVLNELHHTMHHKPQNQKPDFLLDQGGSHKNGSRQGERNVVVARKIESPVDVWRIVWCNYSKIAPKKPSLRYCVKAKPLCSLKRIS